MMEGLALMAGQKEMTDHHPAHAHTSITARDGNVIEPNAQANTTPKL